MRMLSERLEMARNLGQVETTFIISLLCRVLELERRLEAPEVEVALYPKKA